MPSRSSAARSATRLSSSSSTTSTQRRSPIPEFKGPSSVRAAQFDRYCIKSRATQACVRSPTSAGRRVRGCDFSQRRGPSALRERNAPTAPLPMTGGAGGGGKEGDGEDGDGKG